MNKEFLKRNTNSNNRLLIRYLKEYHIIYDFLYELRKQHKISNLLEYFENYMCDNDIYTTLSYCDYSISFSEIENINIRLKFRKLLIDLNPTYVQI